MFPPLFASLFYSIINCIIVTKSAQNSQAALFFRFMTSVQLVFIKHSEILIDETVLVCVQWHDAKEQYVQTDARWTFLNLTVHKPS